MIKKAKNALLMGYLKTVSFFNDLRKDEGGMEIVQVVLLILVGVLAIVLIWGLLQGWLIELWNIITGKVKELE